MIVLRWLWFLIGVGVALQYLYWAAMIIANALGWTQAPPHISQFWTCLACLAAFMFSAEMRARQLTDLLD